jgi:transposase
VPAENSVWPKAKLSNLDFFDTRVHLRQDKLAVAEEVDGYSCIFCTRPLPQEELLPLYFSKDLIEKAFRSLKGIIQLRPVRHCVWSKKSFAD